MTYNQEMLKENILFSQDLQEKKKRDLLKRMEKSKLDLDAALEEKAKRKKLKESLKQQDVENIQAFISQSAQAEAQQKEQRRLKQQEMYLENLKIQNSKSKEREQERYLIIQTGLD